MFLGEFFGRSIQSMVKKIVGIACVGQSAAFSFYGRNSIQMPKKDQEAMREKSADKQTNSGRRTPRGPIMHWTLSGLLDAPIGLS
jgi:hypothetical protein